MHSTEARTARQERFIFRVTIYDIIDQQRAALLARDDATLGRLTEQWAPVAASIEREALRLAVEVARRQAAGERISQAMLLRWQRYIEFARQVRAVVGEYGGTVAPDIARAQREAFDAGVSDAQAQLREMGVSTSFTRLPVEATNVIIGTTADGSPLRDIIAASWPDAVEAITQRLIRGVALGQNPRLTARDMAQASGMSLARALNVARTEQMRAYRESSRALYQQAGITQYRRISAKSARTCPICLALDGRIYDTQNAMHSHPSCRCTSTPIVPGYTFPPRQSAAEWFAQQDEDTQRAVLGPGRLDLYRRGVPLGAMVDLYDDPVWGPQTRARTLAQINADPARTVDMGSIRPQAPVTGRTSGAVPIRRFANADEANGHLIRTSPLAEADLTEDDRDALSYYQGGSYDVINKYLRGLRQHSPRTAEVLDEWARKIDTVLSKSYMPDNIEAYRGMLVRRTDKNAVDFLAQLQPGAVLRDKGYLSTSIDEEFVKRSFANDAGPNYTPVDIKVKIPAGTKGIYYNALLPDGNPDEREFLLPRNTTYKVISREERDGRVLIEIEIVPGGEDV